VRAFHFSPAPTKRGHADATIDLGPGDAPLPEPNLADSSGASTSGESGKFDETALTRALGDQLGGHIAACYERGLGRDPKLWGRLAILMDVDADGRVRSVAEHESRFPDPAVFSCIAEEIRGSFILPLGGPTRVIWPLKLGAAPLPEAGSGRSGSTQTPVDPKRTVAEAGPPRVPVAK
jgi:hypothetical protein